MTTAARVHEFLAKRRRDTFTAAEIADAIGANKTTVAAALKALAEAGTVKPVGVASTNARTWADSSYGTGAAR